jgi:hypothetical protein
VGLGFVFRNPTVGHDEARHTEGALESLFLDDALLHRMQRSVRIRQAFDRQHFPVAHGVRENRTGIMRDVVEQDRAGAAFGAIAPQLGSRESQLVSQRPRQRLLLHDVGSSPLPIDA